MEFSSRPLQVNKQLTTCKRRNGRKVQEHLCKQSNKKESDIIFYVTTRQQSQMPGFRGLWQLQGC